MTSANNSTKQSTTGASKENPPVNCGQMISNSPTSTDDALTKISNTDIPAVVNTFITAQPTFSTPIKIFLDTVNKKGSLKTFIQLLIDTISNELLRNKLIHALGNHIRQHPWQTAFFLVGIVLIANPLVQAGFGDLGPVAGSIAAAWQASMGSVGAGNAFAVLQSWGMRYSVAIPATGGAIAADTMVAAIVGNKEMREGIVGTGTKVMKDASFMAGEAINQGANAAKYVREGAVKAAEAIKEGIVTAREAAITTPGSSMPVTGATTAATVFGVAASKIGANGAVAVKIRSKL